MVHDSVREELASKVSPIQKKEQTAFKETPVSPILPNPVVSKNQETSQIMTKITSATLVGFQNKNATVPDWRLQLQNSVRKRLDNHNPNQPTVESKPHRATLMTNGATALKAEAEEQIESAYHPNPQIAKALRRIEESRQKYLIEENPLSVQPNSVRQFPQNIPTHLNESLPKQEFTNNVSNFAKPNLVPVSNNEVTVEKLKTNKLPPLPPPAKISSSFEKRPLEEEVKNFAVSDVHKTNMTEVLAYGEAEEIENIEETEEIEETEDFAPISLRFNAALFDLLICSFLSLLLLSPFMLLNGRFFSPEGFFAFLATCAIVMFIYLTTTIGFLGRTFGMRLFSLEIVDVEENAYPTLHQAAVSSSVYLLSLGLGGIGFLTMLLNSEKRAAHDLLSGTIIVKEY